MHVCIPADGVTATSPTTAPKQTPVALLFFPRRLSISSQVIMAAAAALLVVKNAWPAKLLAPIAVKATNK